MRKAILVIILAVFAAYCWLAYANQSWYDVPEYVERTVFLPGDVLENGAWDADANSAARFSRLSELRNMQLQPAEAVDVPGFGTFSSDETLDSEQLDALIRAGTHELAVRDPVNILAMASRAMRLRQDVKDADGAVVAGAGEPVDKDVLDRCIAAGVERIPVVGAGDVVGVNATVFMVILIFIGMVMFLQEVFWQPAMRLVDGRAAEIDAGAKNVRENRDLAETIETERRRLSAEAQREGRARIQEVAREGLTEADAAMKDAREKIAAMREETRREIDESVAAAEEALRAEIPGIADEIAGMLAGKRG